MTLKPWRELAAEIVALGAPIAGVDHVSAFAAKGRILARPVQALRPLPAQTHAVMDGFALGAAPPGRYRLLASRAPHLGIGEAMAITAGEPAPIGAAAVALSSRATIDGEHLVVADARSQDNIRRAGEEAAAGAEIITGGVRLDARHLALASAAGVQRFATRRRPRVGLAALHDGPEALPHAGILAALLDDPALAPGDPTTVSAADLAVALRRIAARSDLVVMASESLDAEEGPLAGAIRACGGVPRIGRAALKPAKPIVFGRVGDAIVVGLAGTAYAATVAAHLFLRPLLLRLCGLGPDDPLMPVRARFARERAPGRAEALPVRFVADAEGVGVTLAGRFGQLSALAAMDGIAIIEAEAHAIRPGAALLYHPLRMPLT
jgi:molybdopterin molybdotransferase